MRVPFLLVDVFTDRPLAGNQLCVVPDAAGLDGAAMQAIAAEIGFSESTFVLEASGDRYRMRIFTPEREMPFAGHPTLGTAFALASLGRITSPATQVAPAGEFHVKVDVEAGTGSMEQHAPEFGPELDDLERVAGAVGLEPADLDPAKPPQPLSTGLRHLLVPARTPEAVARAEMRPREVASLVNETHSDCLYLFAVTPEGAKARLFAPGVVQREDPATGSAAGPCGCYMAARRLGPMPGSMVIRQGEEAGRPSTIEVTVEPDGDSWSVSVGGGVRIVGSGEFDVPG
jgi:trans-2,3-dihydro-3-hydroxyanthranilate isomerase